MTVLNVIVEVCYDGDPEKVAVTKRFEEALEYARQEGMLSVLGVFPAETTCDWLTVLGAQDAVDPATARIAQLEKRLRDLAAGARSKADLIASGSPTAAYTKPVDVLRALAKEAEAGLAPVEPAREPADDGEPAENSYLVRWEIDVEADTPRLAAQQAADNYFQGRIGRGEPDTACVFAVIDSLTGEPTVVDLAKPED